MVLTNKYCDGSPSEQELAASGQDADKTAQNLSLTLLEQLRNAHYPNIERIYLNYLISRKDLVHALDQIKNVDDNVYLGTIAYPVLAYLIQDKLDEKLLISKLLKLTDELPASIKIVEIIVNNFKSTGRSPDQFEKEEFEVYQRLSNSLKQKNGE